MRNQLDPANCLGVKSFAETHHCGSLQQAAEKFIHKHFVDVIQCEEFLQLECNEVKELIQNDNITVWHLCSDCGVYMYSLVKLFEMICYSTRAQWTGQAEKSLRNSQEASQRLHRFNSW